MPAKTDRPSRRRERSRGQSLVEFALVAPILLLLFAAAADFGRVFYAYVALENAVKEGAFFGARSPECDDSVGFGCDDPNNVVWRVQNELQNLRNSDGSAIVPTVQCFAPTSTTPKSLGDCTDGDTYTVRATYRFTLLTPVLGAVLGDGLTIGSAASATVLNAANPTPGLSLQKYVDPTGALNETDIRAKCEFPDDPAAPGFYRSPCLDVSTTTPDDVLFARFETGQSIDFRIVLRNTGVLDLTGVSIADSVSGVDFEPWPTATCPDPSTVANFPIAAATYSCEYTLTAPTVPGTGLSFEYVNVAQGSANEVAPVADDVTVVVERPAALEVFKYVSPYRLGDDGDGEPQFGFTKSINIGLNDLVADESVWYRLVVRSAGGKDVAGLVITDSNGPIPFGQSNPDADCDPAPATLPVGDRWECVYRVPVTAPGTSENVLLATADNVVFDSDDDSSATVVAAACSGVNERVLPNLIGLTKLEAQAAWAAAQMTGTLAIWAGGDSDPVVTQSRQAYLCIGRNTGMTVTNVVTP